jgi:hypothetical protein
MYTDAQVLEKIQVMLDDIEKGDEEPFSDLVAVWRFLRYGQDVHSQFGMGFCGAVFRQDGMNVGMSVKATEAGVPLVAFTTSATAIGCIRSYLERLDAGRLNWLRDKYPWI